MTYVSICRMQIKLLSDAPPRLQRKQSIYALHGPNAATELAMLATVSGLDPTSLPVLPALLKKPPAWRVPQLDSHATAHATQLEEVQADDSRPSHTLHAACLNRDAMHDSSVEPQHCVVDLPIVQPAQGMQSEINMQSWDADVQKIAAHFTLNPEQAGVLHHCSQWSAGDKVSLTWSLTCHTWREVVLYKCHCHFHDELSMHAEGSY